MGRPSVLLAEPQLAMEGRSRDASAAPAQYRPDIDGLRAIAVLLVVASHLHVPRLAGGYIGVDVFFVISGYLISSNILPLIRSGSFSLGAFYLRRLRRIFPALIVMLAATLPLAWHFLFPTEMAEYARSLLSAVFACSNTLLWSWNGYFASENELKPLLHTWSLGVEEQFYLIYPLCLLALARLRKQEWIRPFIFSVAIGSFAAAWFFTSRNPHAAFFNVGLRAWELMAGAILSQRYIRIPHRRIARELTGMAGLAAILAPAFLYTSSTPFPGLAAAPPCLGAALLIAAGETGPSLPGRLLSLPPVVFAGLISYSLYLWHWPVQVFYTFHRLRVCSAGSCASPLDHSAQLAIFAISFAIATLSWRFVETPFRRRTGPIPARRLVLASGSAAGVAAVCALLLIVEKGVPSRYPADTVVAASQLGFDTYGPWRWGSCALGLEHTSVEMYDQARCLPFTPGKRHYLLLGDSHAAHLWPGLSAVFRDTEIGQANVAGCNLLPDKMADSIPTCRGMATFIYHDLLRRAGAGRRVDTLIVSAQWHPYDIPDIERLVNVARQADVDVVLVGPSIAYDLPLPRLLGNLSVQGGGPASNQAVAQSHATLDSRQLDTQLGALARDRWRVRYISFFANMCAADSGCPVYASPGVPMLLDTNHFSAEGSIRFAESIRANRQIGE